MKILNLVKSAFNFIVTGVKEEYQIELIRKANPKIRIGKRFNCNNLSKFRAGEGSEFGDNITINCGWSSWSDKSGYFKCGSNVYLGPNSVVFAAGGVEIQDDVLISPSVNVVSHQHKYIGVKPYRKEKSEFKKVKICRNAWIGTNVTILPGVTIGENSIVAANALINKNVPKNVIVAGIPARIIKEI
tara:strand:- start:1264 stop:1824 length:561 start_codon:yes stop_codon:yes gene_type:complete